MQQHYFIGIRIPSAIQELADKYMKQYRLAERYKVVSHPEDLHITFVYLGSCDDQKLAELTGLLRSVAERHAALTVRIDGFNFFGPSSGPRVTYLSVAEDLLLNNLQKDVANVVTAVTGLPVRDRFVPHITIAKKLKTGERLALSPDLVEPHTIPIDRFELFQVHPLKTPKYEAIDSFPLEER